jgi:hypothetical protein
MEMSAPVQKTRGEDCLTPATVRIARRPCLYEPAWVTNPSSWSIGSILAYGVKPMMPFKKVLTADATLAGWEARRSREQALTIVVRRNLPRPLAPRIHVVDARGGELQLAADAGAVAAMLRQRSADLLVALRRQGWEFTGLRVRVQVSADSGLSRKSVVNQPDRSSLRSLAALARSLPPGALKTALERFLRRAG